MEQLFELIYRHGLQPLKIFPDTNELEQQFTSSEFSTLLLLHYHGQLTMSEMAEYLGAPLSTVTNISKRLVEKGFVYREKSSKDRRVIVNCLTEDGKVIAQEVVHLVEQTFAKVEAALTGEELKQFTYLALKVAKALQNKKADNGKGKNKQVQSRNIKIE